MPVFYSRASGTVEPTEKQIMYQQSENLDTFLLYVLGEWKKHYPAIKGNPDYDAEALFVQIHKKQVDLFAPNGTHSKKVKGVSSNQICLLKTC